MRRGDFSKLAAGLVVDILRWYLPLEEEPAAVRVFAFTVPVMLQGAYFIVAARMLGLDCGPMSGFDADIVNAEFFPDGRLKANFLINMGYGDPSGNHPRGPRLPFDGAIKVL